MIILDTNVISEPLRLRPDPRVVTWLDSQVVETLYLTALSLAEIRFGIAILPKGKKRSQLQARFEEEVVPVFGDRVLAFDDPVTKTYATLRSRARSNGTAIGDFDALIASIAAFNNFAVATRDTAPFEAVGVSVFNPFADGA